MADQPPQDPNDPEATKTMAEKDFSSQETKVSNPSLQDTPLKVVLERPVRQVDPQNLTMTWTSLRKMSNLRDLEKIQTSGTFRWFFAFLGLIVLLAALLAFARTQPKFIAKHFPTISSPIARLILNMSTIENHSANANSSDGVGSFSLKPLPAGARVTIDNQYFKPNAQGQIFVPTLTVLTVQITAPGYRPSRFEIALPDQNPMVFHSGLHPAPTGVVDITTVSERKIEILLDGDQVYVGTTPLDGLPLPEGSYTAHLRNDLLSDQRDLKFDVVAEKALRIDLEY